MADNDARQHAVDMLALGLGKAEVAAGRTIDFAGDLGDLILDLKKQTPVTVFPKYGSAYAELAAAQNHAAMAMASLIRLHTILDDIRGGGGMPVPTGGGGGGKGGT